MNKKLAALFAFLLSFILIASNPMSSLAQDVSDQNVTAPSVQVTAPGNDSAVELPVDVPEQSIERSDRSAHGKGLIKPYAVVEPVSSDDITASDESLVGSSEVYRAHTMDEFAELYGMASNEAAAEWEPEFSVEYECAYEDYSSALTNQLFSLAMQNIFPHNGNPTGGDYAAWTYAGASYGIRTSFIDDTVILKLATTVEYYTTPSQEDALTAKLNEVMESLDLENKTEYEKVCAIFDYITSHIVYDYDNLNDDSYKLKHTAYAALVNGTSVCQGYATLFYRMCLTAGLDARVITGSDAPGYSDHAWNIVRIGDLYYNIDATWDAGQDPEEYYYFLRGQDTFEHHFRDEEYDTASFHAEYPMSATDYDPSTVTPTPEPTDTPTPEPTDTPTPEPTDTPTPTPTTKPTDTPTPTPTTKPTDTPTPTPEPTDTPTPTTKPTDTPTPTPKPSSQTKQFTDVQDPTHPYYTAIYWAAREGITGGYKDGSFGINTPCTRGHAVMFLWRLAGSPAPGSTGGKTPFPDVPKTHPYYKAVLWAQGEGITKGYTTGPNKGKFGIDDTCTRGQIMSFIWRFKKMPDPNPVSKSPFSDVPTNHAYYKAILWGSQNGITKGYTSGVNKGKFGINDSCTRGQIVKFLYNIK